MRLTKERIWLIAVTVGLLALAAAPPGLAAQGDDDTRYMSVTLRGRLTDPSNERPMVGAVIRFVSTEASGGTAEAVTNDMGEFELAGLAYTDYVVEIETAEGERIHGINSFPVGEGTTEITLKISDRIVSTTTLENRPERFVAMVNKQGSNWRRFWREFAIFFGIAAGLGFAAP